MLPSYFLPSFYGVWNIPEFLKPSQSDQFILSLRNDLETLKGKMILHKVGEALAQRIDLFWWIEEHKEMQQVVDINNKCLLFLAIRWTKDNSLPSQRRENRVISVVRSLGLIPTSSSWACSSFLVLLSALRYATSDENDIYSGGPTRRASSSTVILHLCGQNIKVKNRNTSRYNDGSETCSRYTLTINYHRLEDW